MDGPIEDHHKTRFHSMLDTCPRGHSREILPQFYMLDIFDIRVGVRHWCPPKSKDLMILVSLAYGSWCISFEGLRSLLEGGSTTLIFVLYVMRKEDSPAILSQSHRWGIQSTIWWSDRLASLSVKKVKAKDGPVSAQRALIDPRRRSHSSPREITGRKLKAGDKPVIDQSTHSNTIARLVFQEKEAMPVIQYNRQVS